MLNELKQMRIHRVQMTFWILSLTLFVGCAGVRTNTNTVKRVADGTVTVNETKVVLPVNYEPEPAPEQFRVSGDRVYYSWDSPELHENNNQWVVVSKEANLHLHASPARDHKNDPLNVEYEGYSMSRPTAFVLRQIATVLKLPKSAQPDYFCGDPSRIPPSRDPRPSMVRALAKDQYVKFAVVYRVWTKIVKIQQAKYCGDDLSKKGAMLEWVKYMPTVGIDVSKP